MNLNLHAQTEMSVREASSIPLTSKEIFEKYFLGNGIKILNVSYEGPLISLGIFEAAQNVIGLDKGIILSTGRVQTLKNGSQLLNGADAKGIDLADGNNNSKIFDSDIALIAKDNPLNLVKYTITFVPQSDTLFFKYVFASEEYPEYVCKDYNDAFGFFVSGPGIDGIYENKAINLALIPNSNLPVTINNIHLENKQNNCSEQFSQYYHNNDKSNKQPVYDAYLAPFTAKIAVKPCEVYKIKIAIADVGDKRLDSAIFLQANSFNSNSIQVKMSANSLIEGCKPIQVTFKLPHKKIVETIIPIKVLESSTATETDYQSLPKSITIPAGEESATFDIIPLEDGINEIIELLNIEYQVASCKYDTLSISFFDKSLSLNNTPEISLCDGMGVFLDPKISVSNTEQISISNNNITKIPDFSSNGEYVHSEIKINNPFLSAIKAQTLEKICIDIEHTRIEDLDIFLLSPDNKILELSTKNGTGGGQYKNTCFSPKATQSIVGAKAPFSGFFLPEGSFNTLFKDSLMPCNGEWQLLITDTKDGIDGKLLNWSICFNTPHKISYQWIPKDGLQCDICPSTVAMPKKNTVYQLKITDELGCNAQDSTIIKVREELEAPVIQCTSISTNTIVFIWNIIKGASYYEVSLDNGITWKQSNFPLAHKVTNLQPGQNVSIKVRAIGKDFCPTSNIGKESWQSCLTNKCELPVPTILAVKNTSCDNTNDGKIEIKATGGLAPYHYACLGTINTTGSFNQLTKNTYNIRVTDSLGCEVTTNITVNSPPNIEILATVTNAGCPNSADGNVIITAFGGNSPYLFKWNTDTIWIPAGKIDGLKKGTYTVFVKDSMGCYANKEIVVSSSKLMELNFMVRNISCNGNATGDLEVEVKGGVAPYYYNWDLTNKLANTKKIQNLFAGEYTITVTDTQHCFVTEKINLLEPEVMSSKTTVKNISCFGKSDGAIQLITTGGTPPYSYSLDNIKYKFDNYFTNLRAGIYSMTIRDSRNCLFLITDLEVKQPKPFIINLGRDTLLPYGDSLLLNASYTRPDNDKTSFRWRCSAEPLSISCVDCAKPLVYPKNQVTYYVSATNENNCTCESKISVYPKYVPKIYVPTAFSPNNDGINDVLMIHGDENIKILNLIIYDRWGEHIIDLKNIHMNASEGVWDGIVRGEKADVGVFVWMLEVLYPTGHKEILKGSITLVR
jgi:gliding motility-associated-like protein